MNCDGRYGLALLIVAACLLLASAGGDTVRAFARFERAAIADGEYGRLLTAHVVHLGLRHTVLNVLGLVLMWALFARDYRPGRWLVIVFASIIAIDEDPVGWRLDHGTLAHVRRRDPDGWILAVFLVGKLGLEQWHALPLAGDVPVVVQAHLYGALGGLAAALCLSSQREPV
mgnify:CR=1 FL=1